MTSCRFCQFVKGEVTQHENGLLFAVLRETPHTLAFLSEQQPEGEEGHILLIPKDHFERLEDVSREVRHHLIDEIALMAQLVRQFHAASNILLNNGTEAGQHEPHLHWHIIPRDINDHIFVDNLGSHTPDVATYESLNSQYRAQLATLISRSTEG